MKFINQFEQTAAEIGISNGYQYVVCGHIHHPEIREIETDKGSITYLNSGDWIENLSALEYQDGAWKIYQFNKQDQQDMTEEKEDGPEMNSKELFQNLLQEFNLMQTK